MDDLLVRGGRLIDGTGAPARPADLLVRAGRVEAVLDPEAPGRGGADDHASDLDVRVLDARGKLVVPGFVDVHTHYDLCLGWSGLSAHCLRQGITSVVGGNCGLGDADPGRALARAAAARLDVHLGVLAPFGPVRSTVVPRAEGRPARPEERARVAAAVARALDAGALGVSWGPYHANALADPDELAAGLSALGPRGKPFVVHRRSESKDGLRATDEALALARAAGAALQVSHLKAAGRAYWAHLEPVLERLERARRDQDVTADAYPYDASLTYLSVVLPDALTAAGDVHARLAGEAGRAQARAAVQAWFRDRQGPEDLVLHEPADPRVAPGATLAEATRALGLADPVEAVLRLIAADPRGTGGWVTYRNMMSPAQVEQLLDLPWVALASDAVPDDDDDLAGVVEPGAAPPGAGPTLALPGAGAERALAGARGVGRSTHPRAFSTFARALVRARARGEAALVAAVRQATSLPAARFGLDRGRLVAGAPADLVVLGDLEDRATHAVPDRYPAGIEAVVVGGRLVLAAGEHRPQAAGALLAR